MANRAMWASWGLFAALAIYSAINGPFRLSREPLFTLGFILLLLAMVAQFWLAKRAYKTVHCGKCRHRFFDRMFVIFPAKSGCSKCDASIEDAWVWQGED